MNQRLAYSILLASASIMVCGLLAYGLPTAFGQDVPGGPPQVRVAPPGEPASTKATGKVQPFRSGLEERETRFRPISPRARVAFNFEDADLPDLVRLISQITGKRFIMPSKARSIKATISSPTDVTAAEAYQAFLSILTINGFALEPAGRYFKIVDSQGAETRVLPFYADGQAIPADDRFITRMVRVEHIAAEDVSTLLTRFKTAEGAITVYAPSNTLIITDTGSSIRRMLRILREIDVARSGDQIWVEPIHHASATELQERLTALFPPEAGGSGGGGGPAKQPVAAEGAAAGAVGARSGGDMRVTNILADERTNSLIIVASERAYMRILQMIRALDVPIDGGGRVHVHNLQYATAENTATVLQSLLQGRSGGGGGGKAPPGEGGAGGVSIQAYKDTNALIITASMQDYLDLRRVIEQIDVPPRQVFIEAVIMELSVERSSSLGLSFHGGVPEPTVDGGRGLSVLGFQPARSLGFGTSALSGNVAGLGAGLGQEALTGLALGVAGPAITGIPGVSIPSFGVLLTALAGSSDVDVLSTPHLLAMDNIEAEINVGQNVPLQTNGFGASLLQGLAGGAGGQAGGLGAAAGLLGAGGLGQLGGGGSVPRQTVGTKIRITPHINDAGEIRMEIEEEISEASAPDPNSPLGVVSIQQRTAKTQVLVRDQQTVVIGGLMRDRVQTRETKVPILGDIPILGALFRTESRQTQKTNLLLFLTPYVIRGPEDLRSIFERHMRERQEFLDRYFVFGDHDYRPPIDYSRTRGLIGEIAIELNNIDEERRLREELLAEPPDDHRPRPAVGEEPIQVIGPGGDEEYVDPDAPTEQGPAEGLVGATTGPTTAEPTGTNP